MNNPKRTDPKQLAQLFTAAVQDTSGDRRVELFRALGGVELYYLATEREVEGRPMWSTPLRRLNDGSCAMVVYTSKRHPDLPENFVGAEWAELLRIAHEAVRADWLVIVNRNNETVEISRDQIPIIIAELNGTQINYAKVHIAADQLERIISDSVHTTSEDWYEPALVQLRGRELYLHMADETASNGQPSIRTSEAAGRVGWIIAYTTRNRPLIRYGGIKWEELVRLIKADAEIPGVRIVNEADDWIILGREVI